jgi:hypothetical protein
MVFDKLVPKCQNGDISGLLNEMASMIGNYGAEMMEVFLGFF